MRLVTHNMLTSSFLKNVKEGYPLLIKATKVIETDSKNYSSRLVRRMIDRLDWKVFISAARGLELIKEDDGIAWDEVPQGDKLEDEQFLTAVHRLLFNVDIVEGELVCPESGRVFPIKDSIPNMLIKDDEK
ncbi:hypothetical protein ACOME3_002845 [Neoechinorhynchus agilis]